VDIFQVTLEVRILAERSVAKRAGAFSPVAVNVPRARLSLGKNAFAKRALVIALAEFYRGHNFVGDTVFQLNRVLVADVRFEKVNFVNIVLAGRHFVNQRILQRVQIYLLEFCKQQRLNVSTRLNFLWENLHL